MTVVVRADSYTGTWSITPGSTPGRVRLEMQYRHADANGNQEWDESHEIPAPQIRDNAFTIVEDAGEFRAQGTFNGAQGGGTWTFVPSANFARELRRRGIDAPTQTQQFELAIAGFKLASLDTLLAAGFARPSAGDLVRMTQHGVTSAFIERMRSHGYTHLSADDLIRLRDHGF